MSLQLSGDGVVTGLDSAASSDLGASLAAKLDATAYQPGLVLISSQSFSAVSVINVDNCFTSSYDTYKIIIRLFSSTANDLHLRLRLSGSDASGSNYDSQLSFADGTSVGAARATGQTVFNSGSYRTDPVEFYVEISGPSLAAHTGFYSLNRDAGSNAITRMVGGRHAVNTAYDGISLIAPSGNLTGTLRIYGYRN
jgi:hypothetical protein